MTAHQRRELEAAAERHGWHVVATFTDQGISGATGRDKRSGLDKMLTGIARKEFDVIAAWSVDRLGRSLVDLVGFLGEVHAKGVDLYLHQQGIDTTTPAGKAMFQMMGGAEFERAMIRERANSGLARARAQGKVLGRPRVSEIWSSALVSSLPRGQASSRSRSCSALAMGPSRESSRRCPRRDVAG
jgi:DNA invertase Pin-like site-specific DNA recombinase